MRGRFTFILLTLAAFAGCGASCKKGPDNAIEDNADDVAIVELPGVDTSSLVVNEKKVFSKVVHDYMSPCGDPVTLEVCVKESRGCSKCMPAARSVANMVRQGEGDKEIREWLDNRFDDKFVKSIPLSGSPAMGISSAPLVVVEFADFQCPHCKVASPIVYDVLNSQPFKGKTFFVFKEFPLSIHADADPAARAAVAALLQGKFWEMHDVLFENQDNLTQADIESYARKLGLDLERFRTDMNGAVVKDRVQKEKDQGNQAGVSGTPTIFVNGRKFIPLQHGDYAEQLKNWLSLEVQLMAGAPSGSSSGGASPSSSGSGASSAAPSSSSSAPVATPGSASASASARGGAK